MPSKHICARWDMTPRSAFSGNPIKHSVIRSIVAENISFALSGERHVFVASLTHRKVVRFPRICILRSDEKISSHDIAMYAPTNLVIWTDESRHFVTRLIRRSHLSSGPLLPSCARIDRVSLAHNSSGIPVAKRRRNRAVAARCWRHEQEGNAIFHF